MGLVDVLGLHPRRIMAFDHQLLIGIRFFLGYVFIRIGLEHQTNR